MKYLCKAFIFIAMFFIVSAQGQTKSGTLVTDEVWRGVITITGDVVVRNVTLTIAPGTQVQFATTNDNRVNGGATPNLILGEGGAINATGTEDSTILFTSVATVKQAALWGEIDIMEDINVDATVFKYCTFECGRTLLDFRSSNHDSIRAESGILIENCTFRKASFTGIYITSGGSPIIRGCDFYDCGGSAVFGHGAGTVDISYTTMSDVSVAIINAGEPTWGWDQTMYLDHMTIYNIRGAKVAVETWWTGQGIFCSASATQYGTLTLTNSIITDIVWEGHITAGLVVGLWLVTNDYNCWYNTGATEVSGGDAGSHALFADPLFLNQLNPSEGLAAGSPCVRAADDSTHIGAWQGVIEGIETPFTEPHTMLGLQVINPLQDKVLFVTERPFKAHSYLALYTLTGKRIAYHQMTPGEDRFVWHPQHAPGHKALAGAYMYTLETPQGSTEGIFIVID